jgi:putative hemolysin
VTELPILGALLVVSAFLSGSETALFALSPADLVQLRKRAPATGRRIESLLGNPGSLLLAILAGNLAVNTAFFALLSRVALAAGERSAILFGAVSAGGLLAILALGDVVPKAVAIEIPVLWARAAAFPIAVLRRAFLPLARPLGRFFASASGLAARIFPAEKLLGPDEIRAYVRASRAQGALAEGEDALLHEVLEFGAVRVREVMTPRVDMVAFAVEGSSADLASLAREKGHARVPVYRGDPDRIEGYVQVEEALLSPERTVEELRRDVLFVPETATVERLLQQMYAGGHELAIAVDEYGGTAGLVTIRDILEEIVGDLEPDDADAAEPVRLVGPRTVLVQGSLPLRVWNGLFPSHIPVTGTGTVAGFLIESLGKVPAEGDAVVQRGIRWRVRRLDRRRIVEVEAEFLEGKAT